MPVFSKISKSTSEMSKSDATTPRTLAIFSKRAKGIAQHFDNSNDPRQQEFESVLTNAEERLADVESGYSSGISTYIAPSLHLKEKKIIYDADKLLDSFQPPPKGHAEEMKKATLKDERAFGSMLERVSQADEELLKGVSEQHPTAERQDDLKSSGRATLESSASEHFASTSSGTSSLQNEESLHDIFEQKLALYRHGNHVPTIMIGITTMGSDGKANVHFIPLKHTFFALADTVVNFNSDAPLPDFWMKVIDHDQNTVTDSGLKWEWQDPDTKVVDAMNKEGAVGIESVYKEAEYVVVLVKEGESENGVPIEIPRRRRLPTFFHMQKEFPGYTVSQVRRLKGDDVANVVFDSRSFTHQTNPLMVELRADPTEPIIRGETLNKGKGIEVPSMGTA